MDYKIGSAINTTSKSKIDRGKKCKAEGKPSFNKKAGWKGTQKEAAKGKPWRQPQHMCRRQQGQWDASFAMGPHQAKVIRATVG